MTSFVLWLYGLLTIASIFMFFGWATAVGELSREAATWNELRYRRSFIIATGLTVNSIAMALACGYRAFDVIETGLVQLGSEAPLQIAILMALSLSKIMFVWAGTIEERTRSVKWPWWAFIYACIIWALACFTMAAGTAFP